MSFHSLVRVQWPSNLKRPALAVFQRYEKSKSMPETSASPLFTYGAKTTRALPEFGMIFPLASTRLLSERTTVGPKKASWVEIVWIEFFFLIFHQSTPNVRFLTGSTMKPKL